MPKMQIGWYAGASTALAGGVVLLSFQQRPNFYSSMVYLAQSNFCLIILINFTLIVYSSFIYGFTRVCFGRLRAIEVEVLTERAWFAITETCLAMTIFRDEIGAWFLVMFTALVTGKVWGWIGDGRVEILEQQPPANPRLFHTRISLSLAISFLYDVLILRYTIRAVIQQARPNMMVMFLFEFAVLTTTSWRTALRYLLSIVEQRIIKSQTKHRLQERRQEVRNQREAMLRERAQAAADGEETSRDKEPLPDENDVEEMDIEVPGWASKGEWVLWLDLITDLLKLAIYVSFFFMLLIFYGLPIHIIRDLFMTTRDFFKRLRALLRYRKAIQEMNRFSDANEEDLSRENTCIICREDMRPWDPANNPGAVDRVRPKKLPCGHILHLGCLKSWLERQQVCPTCRTPVTGTTNRVQANRGGALRINLGAIGQAAPNPAPLPNDRGNNNNNNTPGQAQQAQQPAQRRNHGPRIFNFGPFRLGLADNPQEFNQLVQGAGARNAAHDAQAPGNTNHPGPTAQSSQPDELVAASSFLEQSIQALNRECDALSNTTQQIQTVQLLMAELHRLRQQQQMLQSERLQRQAGMSTHTAASVPPVSTSPMPGFQPNFSGFPPDGDQSQMPHLPFPHTPMSHIPGQPPRTNSPAVSSRHGASGFSIPAGSSELPEGVTIPPGWSLMPLQRLEGGNGIPTQLSSQHLPADAAQPSIDQQPPNSGISNFARATRLPASDSGSSDVAHLEARGNRSAESTSRNSITQPTSFEAPNPVLRNWGESNQPYSQTAQGEQTTTHFPASQLQPATRSVPPTATQESSSSEESSREAESSEEESTTLPKGKARAVTVEEADSSEEESS